MQERARAHVLARAQVFIAGKLIGGADECDAAHRRGELQSLLAEAIGRARM